MERGSGRRGPGRGRPPKNSIWDYDQCRYVPIQTPLRRPREPPRHNRGSELDGGAVVPDPSIGIPEPLTMSRSWNSDEMNEVISQIGNRQNPYRGCTSTLRDNTGQYREGVYAQQVPHPPPFGGGPPPTNFRTIYPAHETTHQTLRISTTSCFPHLMNEQKAAKITIRRR